MRTYMAAVGGLLFTGIIIILRDGGKISDFCRYLSRSCQLGVYSNEILYLTSKKTDFEVELSTYPEYNNFCEKSWNDTKYKEKVGNYNGESEEKI